VIDAIPDERTSTTERIGGAVLGARVIYRHPCGVGRSV
jgi:hypothetical protein